MSSGETPSLPGALWFARLVFVSMGLLLLLALVVVFLGSGSVLIAAEDFVFGGFGGGVGLVAAFVGLVAMPLLYVAVVLLFLPSSNAYVREIRRLRFAGQASLGPPPAPRPE